MIHHENYIADATKTEAVLTSVAMPRDRLVAALSLAIAASDALDLVKKEVFYGKAIDGTKLADLTNKIGSSLVALSSKKSSGGSPSVQGETLTRVLHAAIGSFTEAGELINAVKLVIEADGTAADLDVANLQEETGDLMWYIAILCDAAKIDLDTALRVNIAKLKARYPERFTQEAALNRNLKVERAILESIEP